VGVIITVSAAGVLQPVKTKNPSSPGTKG